MFLRQLDLTTALRPSLYDDENLLFVQDGVGLYEGKFKIPNYQNGHAYLTSHRVCYVDNQEPRKYSVAVDLKEIERTEFYAGFLKSSAKITLFPKPNKRASQSIRSPQPRYASPADGLIRSSSSASQSVSTSPAPNPAPSRNLSATWVCPICGFSNPVPSNFDPSTANQHTPLPPCQACGIKPPLALMIKSAISALSSRPPAIPQEGRQKQAVSAGLSFEQSAKELPPVAGVCERCTYHNHPSMNVCEICGASLHSTVAAAKPLPEVPPRLESPGPSLSATIVGDESIETIKLSFRAGGEKVFLERLKAAMVQRKWLLQSAPPIPRPSISPGKNSISSSPARDSTQRAATPQRTIGIAGLERRGAELRQNNQTVIGTAFEDLEALMTSAKEVIAMAEQFAKQTGSSASADDMSILSDSASALGLATTKDMLGGSPASETLYITELSRSLAEFLTDDRRGVLRKEGSIMMLVDLWEVFNRTRNGIELISPLDFKKAALKWEDLHLPIRLRQFRSGLLVVQERSRTDEKTIASLVGWLREPQFVFPPNAEDIVGQEFGRGVTAQEVAEKFGWSLGVANEELDMAEEVGALCRDQCLDGIRFWENHFTAFDEAQRPNIEQMIDGLVI
ncbi:Vacuolar protein sorting protein 36 Vps36 [Teratosphaeria destructans]|uniref:Vacuolar protein-sorting-associated protein 36 n=1 Tax=Teratosphaeria destructans TaxID=418781 RepID=A0A9W7W2Y3_9PEZI|nr:Vacuolar protein sorting protein 36 Vps36 [Teratosphaeria destructans]